MGTEASTDGGGLNRHWVSRGLAAGSDAGPAVPGLALFDPIGPLANIVWRRIRLDAYALFWNQRGIEG